MAKEIKLQKGLVCQVDDTDYEYLSTFHWYAEKPTKISKTFYVQATLKDRKHVRMHRIIMSAPKGLEVDHIDGNGLNNQRYNLRLATRKQNLHNSLRYNSTGYIGVWKRKDGRKREWQAMITRDGKRVWLGDYFTVEEAALSYNRAAVLEHGDFARLNNV